MSTITAAPQAFSTSAIPELTQKPISAGTTQWLSVSGNIKPDESLELERIRMHEYPFLKLSSKEQKFLKICEKFEEISHSGIVGVLCGLLIFPLIFSPLLLMPTTSSFPPDLLFLGWLKTIIPFSFFGFVFTLWFFRFLTKEEKLKLRIKKDAAVRKQPNWNNRLHTLISSGSMLYISRKDMVPHEIALLSDFSASENALQVLREQGPEDTIALIRLTEKLYDIFTSAKGIGPLKISGDTHELLCRTLDTLCPEWKTKKTDIAVTVQHTPVII